MRKWLKPREYFLLILVALGAGSALHAQSATREKSNDNIKAGEMRSLRNLSPDDKFISREWGFSIALPSEVSGKISLPPGPGVGEVLQWVTKEVGFSITCADFLDPSLTFSTDQQFHNYFAGVRDGVMHGRNAKILTEGEVRIAGQRGFAFAFRQPEGLRVVGRSLVKGRRGFTILASFEENADNERLAMNAINSFRLLPEETPESTTKVP